LVFSFFLYIILVFVFFSLFYSFILFIFWPYFFTLGEASICMLNNVGLRYGYTVTVHVTRHEFLYSWYVLAHFCVSTYHCSIIAVCWQLLYNLC
jgi:hypothetical protein